MAEGMASVPALIIGAFFVIVGLLLMPISLGEGLVVFLIGLVAIGMALAWGMGGSKKFSGAGRVDLCPRCGRLNGSGSLYCTQCGFYLPLPA